MVIISNILFVTGFAKMTMSQELKPVYKHSDNIDEDVVSVFMPTQVHNRACGDTASIV